MDIRLVDILHNIKQWDFNILGQYKMSEDEAKVVVSLILKELGRENVDNAD